MVQQLRLTTAFLPLLPPRSPRVTATLAPVMGALSPGSALSTIRTSLESAWRVDRGRAGRKGTSRQVRRNRPLGDTRASHRGPASIDDDPADGGRLLEAHVRKLEGSVEPRWCDR